MCVHCIGNRKSRIGSLMIGVLITAPNMSNPVADRASTESQTDSCNAGPRERERYIYIFVGWCIWCSPIPTDISTINHHMP